MLLHVPTCPSAEGEGIAPTLPDEEGTEMAGDSKTVFVKGIKYSTSKEHLEQAFSEIGPVRSCFLVQYAETDRHQVRSAAVINQPLVEQSYPDMLITSLPLVPENTHTAGSRSPSGVVSQGCAFVQYALADDASRALQQLNGSFVDGRRVQASSPTSYILCTVVFPASAFIRWWTSAG